MSRQCRAHRLHLARSRSQDLEWKLYIQRVAEARSVLPPLKPITPSPGELQGLVFPGTKQYVPRVHKCVGCRVRQGLRPVLNVACVYMCRARPGAGKYPLSSCTESG